MENSFYKLAAWENKYRQPQKKSNIPPFSGCQLCNIIEIYFMFFLNGVLNEFWGEE
jgi:hypothetical protein